MLYQNITIFFEEVLKDIKCQDETRSYILSIYKKQTKPDFDLSKDSITLLFAQAQEKRDFYTYQNIGDWIFYINTIAPKYFKFIDKKYCDTLGQLSYYSCYKIINRKWPLFEELSDSFIDLEEQCKNKLKDISF